MCNGALLPHDFSNICWQSWEKTLEEKGSKVVLPACLLKIGVVFPEFCNSRCGSWRVDSVTQGSFLYPVPYYLKLNFCGFF